MTITITVPDAINELLRKQFGEKLDHEAREALAVEWYRQEKLSHGQLAKLLGISRYAADGVLKRHGVVNELTAEQLNAQIAAIDQARK